MTRGRAGDMQGYVARATQSHIKNLMEPLVGTKGKREELRDTNEDLVLMITFEWLLPVSEMLLYTFQLGNLIHSLFCLN